MTYFLFGKFEATEEATPFCSPLIPFDILLARREQIVGSNEQ